MNLLFLGGAKRVSIARAFKACENVKIFSYELTPRVPIAVEAEDIIVGKRWTDFNIDSHLREVISSYSIDTVIPFVDGAVAVAAHLSDIVFAPTSSVELSEIMFDKVKCDNLLRKLQLPVPDKYDGSHQRYIAKPRFGSASKGLIEFEGESSLSESTDYLVQEYISNRLEITVDCYVEPISGRICAIIPRERVEVTGGEVTRTRTIHSNRITELVTQVLTLTKLQGAITVQLIHDLTTDRLMVMEINPRLGGGVVCSIAAGANIPKMILNNARGLSADTIREYQDIEMVRYSQEVFFT